MQFKLLTTFPAMLHQYPVLENMVLDSSIETQRKQSIRECSNKYEVSKEAEDMLCVVDKMHSDLMAFVFPGNEKKNLDKFTSKHAFIEGRAFAKVIPRRKTVKESLSLS